MSVHICIYLAVGVAADESLRDVYLVAVVGVHQGIELLADILGVGLGVLVRTHEVKSRQQHTVDALLLHVVVHHVGAQNLALCHNALLLKTREQVFGETAQIVKLLMHELYGLFLVVLVGVQLLCVRQIFALQLVDGLVGTVGVLLEQIVAYLKKGVGSARHG